LHNGRVPDAAPTPDVRLDVWLDVACLFRTRSEAQRACQTGRIEVNEQRAKPHRLVRVGDRLRIDRPQGRRQQVVVKGLADRHVTKAEARLLYEDVTPPPTPEEQALVDLLRLARPTRIAPGTPDTRQRRELRRLKEDQG
jgi:ribosome-associated heat shock protein Hsp15